MNMNVREIYKRLKTVDSASNTLLGGALLLMRTTDPRKYPKDMTFDQLRKILRYVEQGNDLKFEDYQEFARKLLESPNMPGEIGYI